MNNWNSFKDESLSLLDSLLGGLSGVFKATNDFIEEEKDLYRLEEEAREKLYRDHIDG